MLLKKTVLLLFFSTFSFSINSQQNTTIEFGKPSFQELSMKSFPKDPEASGIILYEMGQYNIELVRNYILLIKKVHVKMKVIDASKFKHATINLYLYHTKNDAEKLTKIKAITHNKNLQTYVKTDDYFDIDETENWTTKRFTFPNVKDGSVLEYTYTITTPFFFNFGGWSFQGDMPTVYSEFNSEIPVNYLYNRALYGKYKLAINDVKIKENCFSLPSISKPGDCEITKYVMKDIPAFKEEKYMLAKSNYLARVDYELMTFYDFNGLKHKYSKSWKDVDKEFKNDKDIGRQLNNNNYFEDKLPSDILATVDELEKAKKIYFFIQQHFTWNGNYGVFSKSRVKKAFENKIGSAPEINLSLINTLKAADLDAKLILHSTRKNGLPKTSFPVITDFNYILALLTIGENQYILDASDKQIPFNMVPFKALNIQGRVMDFKKGSYWTPIEPFKKNTNYIMSQLTLNVDETITGSVSEIYTGYEAVDKRKELAKNDLSEYKSKKESSLSDVEINDLTFENIKKLVQPLKEKYTITFSPEVTGDKIYLFPYFLQTILSKNPFQLKERNYLVELGYPISNTYILSLDLQGKYEVEHLPSNKKIKLMGDAGECTVLYSYKSGKISLRFSFNLKNYRFYAQDYQGLKDFFNQVVEIQTKEAIVLKRI